MYESRNFAIFSTTELDKINFSEVLETSAETVRLSVDGTKTFVKWDDGGTIPPSVQALTTLEGIYTYEEILEILSGPEWTEHMTTKIYCSQAYVRIMIYYFYSNKYNKGIY
jgi:hypothetical protein